jgi:CRISPR/Cas system type I-B associated protein Csh2 (Cas7 group RAMP superfamily)
MEYSIKAADSSHVHVTDFEGGVWISIHRQCGYTSTGLTREQAERLRDALIALTETTDAAQ